LKLNDSKETFEPKKYEYCLAQFSEDKNWYRAKINRVEKNYVYVFYIDFGNQEKVKFEKLKPIPESLKKYPHQAKEAFLAYLYLSNDNFRQEALNLVKQYASGNDLVARHEYSRNGRIYISLFDAQGKYSVNADLIRNGLAFVTKNEDLINGQFKETFAKQISELLKEQDEAKK